MTSAPTTEEIKAAVRAFSGDIRCSRGGGQTCAKCADKQECSVCYIQRHGRVLVAEVERLSGERAAVVAWLRSQAYLTLYETTPDDVADAIERGDHLKEVADGPA